MSKHFLIVGASGGIGSAVLSKLVASGNRCITASRHDSPGTTSKNPAPASELVTSIFLDLADSTSITAGARTVRSMFPALDGIVFASGVAAGSIIQMTKGSKFTEMNQINAIGPIQLLSGLMPHLNPGSSVVFLSSASGAFVQRGNGGYGASKLLLERLVQGLALEVPKNSLRIHLVVPGPVEGGMLRGMDEQSAKEMIARSSTTKPISAADLADLVDFLLSKNSGAISSGKLVLDAGFW